MKRIWFLIVCVFIIEANLLTRFGIVITDICFGNFAFAWKQFELITADVEWYLIATVRNVRGCSHLARDTQSRDIWAGAVVASDTGRQSNLAASPHKRLR